MNLELINLVKQAGQSAPGIHLPLPPEQGWGGVGVYRRSCASMLCEHWGSELGSTCLQQHALYQLSHLP